MSTKQQVADDDLESLRTQKNAATAKATAAERAAAALTEENDKLRNAVGQERASRVQADEVAAANALAAAESEAAAAERAIEAAMAANDGKALATATRSLSTAQGNIRDWSKQQTAIKDWKTRQVARLAAEAEAAKATPEAPQYPEKTKAWLDAHPEVRDDQAKLKRAQAAHFEALAKDIEYESPEYFALVEERLGLKTVEKKEETEQLAEGEVEVAEEETQKTGAAGAKEPELKEPDVSASAVPPQRKTPALSGKAPAGKLRLTAAEVEAAQFSNPDMKKEDAIREYAKNKVALQTQGRIRA